MSSSSSRTSRPKKWHKFHKKQRLLAHSEDSLYATLRRQAFQRKDIHDELSDEDKSPVIVRGESPARPLDKTNAEANMRSSVASHESLDLDDETSLTSSSTVPSTFNQSMLTLPTQQAFQHSSFLDMSESQVSQVVPVPQHCASSISATPFEHHLYSETPPVQHGRNEKISSLITAFRHLVTRFGTPATANPYFQMLCEFAVEVLTQHNLTQRSFSEDGALPVLSDMTWCVLRAHSNYSVDANDEEGL